MKNILLLSILAILLGVSGCDQEPDLRYDEKDRIYFEFDYEDYNARQTFDSVVFSFGRHPDGVLMDTAKLVVKYLGRESARQRKYRVTIVADSTTAVEGVHYLPVSETQTFRDTSLTDTLRVVLLRENLSSSHITKERRQIYFRLEANEDFELGLVKGINMRLIMNNYLSKPRWWNTFEWAFNFYHPEKWKILMMFDDGFKDETQVPFDGNALQTFSNSLNAYLNANIVKDKETGQRIYMDKLVDE